MKRSSEIVLRASIAATRLRTERSPQPSRFLISSTCCGQPEDVARHLEQPVVEEILDVRAAQALDVEAVARHEVAQPLDLLERAFQPAACSAAPRRPPRSSPVLQRTGAVGREVELLRLLRPLLRHDSPATCGITSPARWIDDHVADAHVEPLDLVGIVQAWRAPP